MDKLYTASQARERLGGMSSSSFKRLVDSGKIRKVTPPNKVQGMYIREDVDNLAEAMENFVEIYSASEPVARLEFGQAKDESDIKETVQIARQHFGDNAYGLEKRMTWFKRFPNGDYVLRHEGVIVGYFSAQAIKPESVDLIFHRKNGASVQLQDMIPIQSGYPLDLHVSGIGVKMGISRTQAKYYGMVLLNKLFETLVELGRQGVDIRNIWSKSSTVPGIKLSRDLKFTELGYINNEQIGFVLDMKKANLPAIKRYREALKESGKTATK